jgi:hypothetical protein
MLTTFKNYSIEGKEKIDYYQGKNMGMCAIPRTRLSGY